MAVDFDHAIVRGTGQSNDQHIEHSGTLSFMSVNNLEGNFDWCTSLDDWESATYLMSWLATYGFNSDYGRGSTDEEDLLIHNWMVGKLKKIAKTKRVTLSSKGSMNMLMSDFIKDGGGHYRLLQKLVEELRTTLVESSPNPLACGTDFKTIEEEDKLEDHDPFYYRVAEELSIARNMQQVLDKYAEEAKTLL